MEQVFDEKRAMLRGPDLFKRLKLAHSPRLLSSLGLDKDVELVVFEQAGQRYGLKLLQLAYHHVAQGDIGGVPTLIAFCGICHSGMGFSPLVDGEVRHFSAGGLYDGIVLLTDDETRSYWNHMTGECVSGPDKGCQLEAFSLDITTVGAELGRGSDALIWEGKPTLFGRFMAFMLRRANPADGFMPFFFRRTMVAADPRAERMEQGLGVIVGSEAKFYPVSELSSPLTDTLNGQLLSLRRRPEDHVPEALDAAGRRPMQLFCRWYGFSATDPHCAIARRTALQPAPGSKTPA